MEKPILSYWELVEPVFALVDISSPEKFAASSAFIPIPILQLYASHFALSEIHNGGLLQFFWNGTGVMLPEAIAGFKAIGMTKLASVITTAAGKLGSPYPRDRDDRWDALLEASGRDVTELEEIFAKAANLYLAFEEAVEPLSLSLLSTQVWDLAQTEQGNFGEAATRYAQSLTSIA